MVVNLHDYFDKKAKLSMKRIKISFQKLADELIETKELMNLKNV